MSEEPRFDTNQLNNFNQHQQQQQQQQKTMGGLDRFKQKFESLQEKGRQKYDHAKQKFRGKGQGKGQGQGQSQQHFANTDESLKQKYRDVENRSKRKYHEAKQRIQQKKENLQDKWDDFKENIKEKSFQKIKQKVISKLSKYKQYGPIEDLIQAIEKYQTLKEIIDEIKFVLKLIQTFEQGCCSCHWECCDCCESIGCKIGLIRAIYKLRRILKEFQKYQCGCGCDPDGTPLKVLKIVCLVLLLPVIIIVFAVVWVYYAYRSGLCCHKNREEDQNSHKNQGGNYKLENGMKYEETDEDGGKGQDQDKGLSKIEKRKSRRRQALKILRKIDKMLEPL